MATGIIIGALVPDAKEALDRGKFVGVSLPIGMSSIQNFLNTYELEKKK